jgi:DNA-binding NtrC family response regulator
MSRVMLFHCRAAEERALLDENLSFVCCDDCEEMLSEVVQHPPDVVVVEVRPESVSDLAVLSLLRRVAPRLPFVLVGEGRTPEWDVPAELAPLYRSPLPVEKRGLRKVVRSALAARGATRH